MPRILLVTGEASGDLHGGYLASALMALNPELQLCGVGGGRMEEAGVKLLPGLKPVDAIGLLGAAQLWRGAQNFLALRRVLRRERFAAVVLIDSPGMNIRLASVAAKAGQRVIYYIAPQVWAWGRGRLTVLAQVVHRMLVILPFETTLFQQAGIPCTFVGHPLLDEVSPGYDRSALRREFGLPEDGPIVGLFPGSREREVRALLPAMLEASRLMRRTFPNLQGVLGLASSLSRSLLDELIPPAFEVPLTIIPHRSSEVMAVSDVAWVASGTATLEAALVGTPMVIVYRVPWLTFQVAKRLIHVPHIGLVNVLAGKELVPELIQHDVTPELLSREARRMLQDPQVVERVREEYQTLRRQLGAPGASRRAAQVILKECTL